MKLSSSCVLFFILIILWNDMSGPCSASDKPSSSRSRGRLHKEPMDVTNESESSGQLSAEIQEEVKRYRKLQEEIDAIQMSPRGKAHLPFFLEKFGLKCETLEDELLAKKLYSEKRKEILKMEEVLKKGNRED